MVLSFHECSRPTLKLHLAEDRYSVGGVPKLVPRHDNHGQLEMNVGVMADHLAADLHQLLQ